MLLCVVAILSLIRALADHDKWDQNWYTDDSACATNLQSLCEWFDKLVERGPVFGNYPEP